MTKSEKAVNELRRALGDIDYERAIRALVDLQETRTIDRIHAEQLSHALGTIRAATNSFSKADTGSPISTKPRDRRKP